MRRPVLVHPARRRRIRGHGYFKRLGPGIVTGAADDDPSGIGTYSQVGAAYGLGLIWSALYVAPLAAAVQEMAARLGLCRGVGLSTLIRERFPRAVLYLAVSLVAVANTFNIAADLSSMGASAHLVVPIPAVMLTVAMTGLMLGLEIAVSYHRYAKVLRWLAVSLLAYLFVLASIDVNWSEVAHHALVPHLVGGRAGLAALLAVFGTTVSPYLFFWQTSEEVEEETDDSPSAVAADQGGDAERSDQPTVEHLRAMRVDVVGGMVSACVVAFAIMVAAAAPST